MTTLDNRELVAFSVGNGSGLMFYVSRNAQTGDDYRVFISYLPVGDSIVITLDLCEFREEPSLGCRCPDDDCDHKSTYYVYYRARPVDLNVVRNCTQLNPNLYLIDEYRDQVVINKKDSAVITR